MTDTRRRHDAAYKQLFSQPRMVQDLLDGFAARDWSEGLDLDSLTPLPASYAGHDLRQRHGDLVWRVRFRDDRWLYLVLLLEFQSDVDRSMAVRMLTYTGLLHQRLIDEGVLREHGALPPVLPIVIYNGRGPWTAPTEVAELVAATDEALTRYQPSQEYFLLDAARTEPDALPGGNLVSALVALETTRDRAQIERQLRKLIDLLGGQDDDELKRAFSAWARQALMPAPFRPTETEPLAQLEEVRSMLAETVREWTKDWVAQGREEGLKKGLQKGREEGRAEERSLLCRLAARKFDGTAAGQLAEALAGVDDPARLGQVGEWIIECETAAEPDSSRRRTQAADGHRSGPIQSPGRPSAGRNPATPEVNWVRRDAHEALDHRRKETARPRSSVR